MQINLVNDQQYYNCSRDNTWRVQQHPANCFQESAYPSTKWVKFM